MAARQLLDPAQAEELTKAAQEAEREEKKNLPPSEGWD